MMVEFTRDGKTYCCAVGATDAIPPAVLRLAFRPCVKKPPVELVLDYVGRDEIRGLELYRPVEEMQWKR